MATDKSGIRSQESGIRNQESGVRSQESQTTQLAPDPWPLTPDRWPLAPDPWPLCRCLLLAAMCLSAGCAGKWGNCSACGPLDRCGYWGWHGRSFAIPETYPLGSTNRAHYHTMQANAEAADFIIHRHEFVGKTAELTPDGKDHILEMAARMRSSPFPVLVERSENNSEPELDGRRRRLVAQILTDFGAPEADQRTFVSPAYGRGINSREAEFDYYQFLFSRGFNNFGAFGNNFGQFGGSGGGFGGGAGGGFGFGR